MHTRLINSCVFISNPFFAYYNNVTFYILKIRRLYNLLTTYCLCIRHLLLVSRLSFLSPILQRDKKSKIKYLEIRLYDFKVYCL